MAIPNLLHHQVSLSDSLEITSQSAFAEGNTQAQDDIRDAEFVAAASILSMHTTEEDATSNGGNTTTESEPNVLSTSTQ